MHAHLRLWLSGLLFLAGLVWAGTGTQAQIKYRVTLDTSGLVGHAAGPFALDFLMLDGDGVVNNTVTVSDVDLFGGSASGGPTVTGGAVGDLFGGVTLTDSDFFNDLFEGFTPGKKLSFVVNSTTNYAGGTPNSFTFSILDSMGAPIPTLDPFGTDVLSAVDLTGPTTVVQTFGGDSTRLPVGGGGPIVLSPPVVTAVPEPGALALLGAALPALALLRRRLR